MKFQVNCVIFMRIYTSKNVCDFDIENYLESSNMKTLSTTTKDNCDEFPTLDDK